MKLTPLNNNVLMKEEERQTKTTSGIIISTQSEAEKNQGRVIEIGKDVKDVVIGDVVVFESYKATDFEFSNERYMIVEEKDILAKFK